MLLNVQALRGLAAFLVVFVHLETLARLAGLPAGITVFGNSGVDVFFVISGLIMVVTTSGRRQTPQGFLRNRLTRIAPLYWAITLAVFALAVVAPSLLQSTTADPIQLAKSLAFIPYARADGAMHPVVFVGWTLNYEMAFYVIFALGLLLPSRRAGLALSIAVLAAAAAAGLVLRPADPVLAFYTAPMILEFGAGMLLGALFVADRLPRSRAAGWIAVAAGAAAFAVMVLAPTLWPSVDRAWAAGIPALVIVTSGLVAERAGLVLRQGWIQLLGASSYATYLTHFFCTQVVSKAGERLAGLGPAMAWALIPVAFVLVAMVGVFAHRRIELPLTELARRWLAPLGPRPRPTIAGGAW
ncbi:acyltransferase family protein [Phenylobacterium soli]|uniref:Acyltransferase n=1 Tax=Phenylobacterium soli TaxID=2170551 RepID=A0A328ARL7_9CAUL|nr:acyltransferase [Phenylobacterium soli]RAK55588.1 acyltransferase [Phenylobacterium soli]